MKQAVVNANAKIVKGENKGREGLVVGAFSCGDKVQVSIKTIDNKEIYCTTDDIIQ
jgi:hypothetical protein